MPGQIEDKLTKCREYYGIRQALLCEGRVWRWDTYSLSQLDVTRVDSGRARYADWTTQVHRFPFLFLDADENFALLEVGMNICDTN